MTKNPQKSKNKTNHEFQKRRETSDDIREEKA
jgi:hypothetical protein